jgi:DNA-3-methyladenine glycosylase II
MSLKLAEKTLKKADPALGAFIDRIGPCKLSIHVDTDESRLFKGLAKAIVSQQLSGKAAATIFSRVEALGGHTFPSAGALASATDETLRGVGLSRSKASYVRDLAQRVHSRRIDLTSLAALEDEHVIESLVGIKGIGRWTAQMFLIFHLGRLDVFAPNDLGLQKGIQRLLSIRSLPSLARMEKVAKTWRPYRSVASWYLWRITELPKG